MHRKFRRLTDDFWVAPQLVADDLSAAAALGIRTVVNNRPDNEADAQPAGAEIERAARAAGLDYVHVPVVSGGIFPDHVAAMAEALDSTQGPWLLFCRSGTRSCYLWALVAARTLPPHEIVEAAAAAGYDLAGLWSTLEAIHIANREPSLAG